MESNTNQPKHTASEKDSTIDIKEEFPTLASDNKANIIQAALTEQNTLNQTSMDIDEDKKNININTTTPPPITTTTTSLPSTAIPQNECNILTPTLADILSDDLMLRFYQCVKDIRLQRSPTQTSSMFFALCHALGDTISFLKVPNMNKIMFRQDEQIFAVNISGIVPPVSDNNSNNNNNNNNNNQSLQQSADNLNILANVHYDNTNNNNVTPISSSTTTSNQYTQMDNNHNNNNTTPSSSTTSTLAAAAAAAANFFSANDQSQQLLQAALSTVNSHDPNHPLLPNVLNPVSEGSPNISNTKSKTPKKPKKPSPRDKEYAVRRNEIIQDLLKVTEANLLHQANTVDEDIKLIIQGQERNTKLGLLSPLHRFATFANLTAHYDSDFAPKNAGVYYNYEYFQLFLAFRDLELERTQQMQHHKQQNESVPKQASSTSTSTSSPSSTSSSSTTTAPTSTPPVNYTTTSLSRPVMTQCRADIEKVLVNTNWEAIRRRLIIGERIYQLSNVIGRGFLLLSKQVSGRKLLHNFNTTEWTLLLHEFERPESLPLLRVLQTKYSPERLYQHHHPENAIYSQGMTESAAAAAAAEAMKVLPLLSQSQQQPSQNNMPTTSLTPSSSSTSSPPPKAYVDNNNSNINNNENESNQVASSNNYIASLPHTTTTNNTLAATSMVPENTLAVNNDQRENNNDNNHISSNDNTDFYQNINDPQDGNRRKKLKTKE